MLEQLKAEILTEAHDHMSIAMPPILASDESHKNKAKKVNKLVQELKENLVKKRIRNSRKEKQSTALTIEYCCSVLSLEYRHAVWPYEYMALSRRVGELWERFCKSAWDYPTIEGLERIEAPTFDQVGKKLEERIRSTIGNKNFEAIKEETSSLFRLIGDVNMKEDETFKIYDVPHIVDFKSGFGSNEKGNTLRLLTVAEAYKVWNPNTRLHLIVRQEQNNNYLELLRKSPHWEVSCGDLAYEKIDELTGSNMSKLKKRLINFEHDLSEKLIDDLSTQLTDLTAYLNW